MSTLATIGRCIYCGRAGGEAQLTREHIIPRALGGKDVLADASCPRCQNITKRFEQNVFRPMMGLARVRLGVQTRHKADRDKPFRVEFTDSNVTRIINVHHSDLPAVLVLPLFERPTFPNNPPADVAIQTCGLWSFSLEKDLKAKLSALAPVHGTGRIVLSDIPLDDFARVLAKMGHTAAVASQVRGAFEPVLPRLILKEAFDFAKYVGCPTEIPSPTQDSLVELRLNWSQGPYGKCLLAQIRLFGMLGAPVYHVIVGEPITHSAQH